MQDILITSTIVAGCIVVTLIPVLTGLLIYCIVKTDKAKKPKFVPITSAQYDNCIKEWRIWTTANNIPFAEFMTRIKGYDTKLEADVLPIYGKWTNAAEV